MMKRKQNLAQAVTLGLLLTAPCGVMAAIPGNMDADIQGKGPHYVSQDVVGNGHSIIVTGQNENEAKLQISNGNVSGVKNVTVTADNNKGLFNHTGGTVEIEGTLTADSAYVKNNADFSAKEANVEGYFNVNDAQSSATVNGTLTAGKFSNSGTAIIGSTNISGDLSNSGTLTVKDKFNVGGKLNNSGTLYLNAGKLEFPAMDFTNSGVLKKNESENLDSISLNSLRNKADLEADTINVNNYIYNGDQGTTAKLSANNITTGTFINYENGTLNVEQVLEASKQFDNKGTAVLNNINVSKLSNSGKLTIKGKIVSLGQYANNTGTLTFSEGSYFAEDVVTQFGNSGTMYVASGKLDAQGMTLINNKGAELYTSTDKTKLDSINVANLRNEASIEVGQLESTGIVFNGEQGNKSSLAADSIKAGSTVLNTNSSTLEVTGSVKTKDFTNDKDAKATIDNLEASVVVNNKNGATLTVNTADVEWIDNATGAEFKGKDVTVARMLNEEDAVLKVEKLTMKNSVDGEVPRLQLYSTAESHIGSLSGKNIRTTLEEQSGKVYIGTVTAGSSMDIYVPDTQVGRVEIDCNQADRIDVIGDSDVTNSFGDDVQAGMQALADTVTIKGCNGEKNIIAEDGKIYGTITGITDQEGNVIINNNFVNKYNQGISEMASISLMTWRAENNDMNKRLGELRDSDGEHGIWTRMTRGESEYGNQSIKNQYNSYQIGYDEKLSVDKSWTVGAALTYTDAESSFTEGTGENTHKGLALYGSKLNEDGSYIDLIAKYARLEHEFDVAGGAGKGGYNINGYSISAEYGKRFEQGNSMWIEPQAELTYGKVSSVNYVTNQDVHVQQDGMDSLVGRIGVRIGKDIKHGNVYARASYLYDFEGETSVAYSYKGKNSSFEQDLGGGWFEVGVGTNINLSDATYLYFDVEKTYGGDVATPWQWNAGLRYSF